MDENPNSQTYTQLAQVTLARVIIFHKWCGEATRMEREQYDNVMQWDGKDNAEIQATMRPHEV